MEKTYKNCQSCGMPLKKDPAGGATNADGSKSAMYCSHCYEMGAFKQPGLTLGQMKDLVKSKLKEMGFPGFLAGFFARGIPKLERWKKQTA
jgi:hypothetical protein